VTCPPPQPRLLCLVVTRDDAVRLPAWLDAVRPLADGIIALDEGSTDGTLELLEREPLVGAVLRGQARDRGSGPDRLLEAAADLRPDWLLWLRVDERVAPDDVEPLRGFLADDALPGLAYGLSTGGEHVAFRLFAPRRGQRMPEHGVGDAMVPADIPPCAMDRHGHAARAADRRRRHAGERAGRARASPGRRLARRRPRLGRAGDLRGRHLA
jgi:Glycosyl transferase family 2